MKIDAQQIKTSWSQALNESYKDKMMELLSYSCDNGQADFEMILTFPFKQANYYVRNTKDYTLNWASFPQSNIVQINRYNGTLISDNLYAPIENAVDSNLVDVIYPDYSSVDVGQGITWPTKVFSPYVDATAWPPYMFADLYPIIGVLYFNLGFIVSQSPTVCKPTWGTYYSGENGPLNSQIKAIRQMGGDVNISFGGAANVPLHITAPTVDVLFKQYKLFADAYGLTRIDFDLEGIWIDRAYSQDNIKNSQAIKMLQDDYNQRGKTLDVWFTLPVLPSGLTQDGLDILQYLDDAGVKLGGVNVMAMDYGNNVVPDPQGRMGELAISAMRATQMQIGDTDLSRIGVTPMLGVNDVEEEVFMQSDAKQVLEFAQQVNAGQISMWSSNRDFAGGSGIPQSDYEFTKIFNQYNSSQYNVNFCVNSRYNSRYIDNYNN